MARYDFPIVGFNKLQKSWSTKFYNATGLLLLLEAWSVNNKEPDREALKAFLIANLYVDPAMANQYNKEIAELILKRDFKNLRVMLSKLSTVSKKESDDLLSEMSIALGFYTESGQFKDHSAKLVERLKFYMAVKISKEYIRLHKLDSVKAINNRYEKQVRRALLDSNMHVGSISADIYNNVTSNYCTHHMWMSVSPEDAICSGPTGETRKVGSSFSNGLIAPPAHYGCACYLIPTKK